MRGGDTDRLFEEPFNTLKLVQFIESNSLFIVFVAALTIGMATSCREIRVRVGIRQESTGVLDLAHGELDVSRILPGVG